MSSPDSQLDVLISLKQKTTLNPMSTARVPAFTVPDIYIYWCSLLCKIQAPTKTVKEPPETSRILQRGHLISPIKINRHGQFTPQRANPSLNTESTHGESDQCPQPIKLFPRANLVSPKCFVYIVCFCGTGLKMGAVDITLVPLSFGKSLSMVTHIAIQRCFNSHFRYFSPPKAFTSVYV